MTSSRDPGESKLGLEVDLGPEADAEAVAEVTRQLRRELLDLDVESVEAPPGAEAPPGSRGVELAALGTLVVTLANPTLLAGVVTAIRSWVGGVPQRSVKLQLDGDVLELTGVSSEEQNRLAEAWLRRQAKR